MWAAIINILSTENESKPLEKTNNKSTKEQVWANLLLLKLENSLTTGRVLALVGKWGLTNNTDRQGGAAGQAEDVSAEEWGRVITILLSHLQFCF